MTTQHRAAVVIIILFAMTTSAAAEFLLSDTLAGTVFAHGAQLPTTLPIKNKDGEVVGTATSWGNVITYRDLSGELVGSSVLGPDNVVRQYDPSGKPVEKK